MRDFLKDKHIVGAMLVSRVGSLLDFTASELLKWCDVVLLMIDNEDEPTRKSVDYLKGKYGDKIIIEETGFPRATEAQEHSKQGLLRRFKPLQGPIRQKVFDYIKKYNDTKRKVDILIWPDSDEVFSNSFRQLLIDFVNMPEKKAITMKPVDVFGDMSTIHGKSMTGHVRVMKWFPELTAIPYRTACNYRPLEKKDRVGSVRVLIHLASLNLDIMKWRKEHWKPNRPGYEALWLLPRDIRDMSPDEIKDVVKQGPNLTVDEFLGQKGINIAPTTEKRSYDHVLTENGHPVGDSGGKFDPVGVENIKKLLKEVDRVFKIMNIQFFLLFGSALMLYRDGEFKSWDWDLDIGILARDLDKFDGELIKREGFSELKIKRDMPKFKTKDGVESEELLIRTISFKKFGVRCDIDPVYQSSDRRKGLILKGRKREKFVSEGDMEWFKHPVEIEYNGGKYMIPSKTGEYLISQYGSNWKTPIREHRTWRKRSARSDVWEIIIK